MDSTNNINYFELTKFGKFVSSLFYKGKLAWWPYLDRCAETYLINYYAKLFKNLDKDRASRKKVIELQAKQEMVRIEDELKNEG